MVPERELLLDIKDLKMHFEAGNQILMKKRRLIKAVDGISLKISRGETIGLVGESGCGKTTFGKTIVGLYKPTGGRIWFKNREMSYSREYLLSYRKNVQMIFQNPYTSLDPKMTVENIIGEALDIHRLAGSANERKQKIHALLNKVGLDFCYESRYPHELSGGQRQRVGIARSLAVNPELIICDEPVSALDVSVQAQIVNMLKDIQSQSRMAYLFISHNISIVRYVSDKVGVMYLGKLVETADCDELFRYPAHPYTRGLLASVPALNAFKQNNAAILEGEIPDASEPPAGCRFKTRCRYAADICTEREPLMKEVAANHFAACHLL